jgi:N-acetylmuramoyl-L-alanine amidase
VDSLILHYTGMTTGDAARARLLDPTSEVSCHYLVWEDGRIEQMVAEMDRAWHAGRSSWGGETDINSVSIGIEIVNPGHDGGCPPYPAAQIDALIALAKDICARHRIVKRRVLAHSDVAPGRKMDPGEYFPWAILAAAGIGVWRDTDPTPSSEPPLSIRSNGAPVLALQRRLSAFGYACPTNGVFDPATVDAVVAFQRHYDPRRIDGIADGRTSMLLDALLTLE